MSDEQIENQENDSNDLQIQGGDNLEPLVTDELTELKKKADLLGLSYHPNIGVDKLRIKVDLAIRGGKEPDEPDPSKTAPTVAAKLELLQVTDATVEEIIAGYQENVNANLSEAQRRNEAIREVNKLIRVRVTCMNPNKSDWTGEILTVSNSIVGTYKKFVPFNIEEGWHIPQIIYQALLERKCQIFVQSTNERGDRVKAAKLVNEFSVEVMNPLTENELKELRQRQIIASGSAQ